MRIRAKVILELRSDDFLVDLVVCYPVLIHRGMQDDKDEDQCHTRAVRDLGIKATICSGRRECYF